jgi:hypothetical protein
MDNNNKKIDIEAFNRLQVEVNKGLVCQEFDGEMVILEMQSGQYFGIDVIGSRIWQMLESKVAPVLMIEKLQEEFEVEPELCRHQVVTFLDELERNKLIRPVSLPSAQ